jgi:23S rRNA (uracil1939-C5)-methyltransferase
MTCSRTGRRPPRVVELTIDSLAFGGDAVGRDADGRVTFVPDAAPGDRVRAELTEEHKGWARTRLARVLEPGASRVEPPCPLAVATDERPACGGCQWQHVTIAAQQAAKLDIVQRALRKVTTAVEPLRTPCPPLGWRRRARLRARGGQLGFNARRSHALVDVPLCLQLEPQLGEALATVRRVLGGSLASGSEVMLLGGAGVHVVVARSAPLPRLAELVGQGGIVGVRQDDTCHGEQLLDLTEPDDVRPFWGAADLFAQASRAGNRELRGLVRELVGPAPGRVLELHAGSGNFTRDLLVAGARVTAVEEVPAASRLAERNLAGLGEVRHVPQAFVGSFSDVEAADLVLLDPPRLGLVDGGAEALARFGAPAIVYVSCDPETLARDLGVLSRSGYRVTRAIPLDLMPQTSHVELVVRLERPSS